MDAFWKLTYRKRSRGSILVLIAFAIFGLIAMAALVIDFGFFYSTKSQLQNAADSSALAGVALLDGTNSTDQTAARNEAIKFAAQNSAAGTPVSLDSNNGNSGTGDIQVGNWDPALTPKFLVTRLPINAVKVLARRTTAKGNSVSTILGNILNITNVDIGAQAIAAMVLNGPPLILCGLAPGSPPGTEFELNGPGGGVGTAWTLFLPDTNVNTNALMGESLNYTDHCSLPCIGTTNGTNQPVLNLVNDAFDSNKVSGTWEAVVPIVDGHCVLNDGTCPSPPTSCTDSLHPQGCPPGSPTGELDHIAGWAKAYITSVNLTGKKGFTAQIGPLVPCGSNPLGLLGKPKLVN